MTPIVTTHAIDRFIERFPGAEPDRAAAQRAIGAIVAKGVAHGAVGVVLHGCTFVLNGCLVVTVFRGRHRHMQHQAAFCRRRITHEVRA